MLKRLKFAIVLPVLNVGLAWIVLGLPVEFRFGDPTPPSKRILFAKTVCMAINAPALDVEFGVFKLFQNLGFDEPVSNWLVYIGFWWFLVGLGFDLRHTRVRGLLRAIFAAACVGAGVWILCLAIGATQEWLFAFQNAFLRAVRSAYMMGCAIDFVLSVTWAMFLFWAAFKQVPKPWFRRVAATLRRPVF